MEPYKFPRPPTDQDFEALIERLNRDRHPNANVQRFGRNGQAQHGVDVLVTRADGTADAYQCKHVESLGEATVLTEANKARSFPGGLSRFIIYSSTRRNTRDQLAARKATKDHRFLVAVSSWDDIAVDMMNNLEASQQYMSKLPMHSLVGDYTRQLRIAFDRPAFVLAAHLEWSFMEQLQAIRNTEEFLTTGQLNTRDARFVLRSLPASSVPGIRSDMSSIRKLLRELKSVVTPAAKAERAGGFGVAAQHGHLVEPKRIALMDCLNSVLVAHRVEPINF